jgi:hypothetical protein
MSSEHPLIAQRMLRAVIDKQGKCTHHELCPLKDECFNAIYGPIYGPSHSYTAEWRLIRAKEKLEELDKIRYLEELR